MNMIAKFVCVAALVVASALRAGSVDVQPLTGEWDLWMHECRPNLPRHVRFADAAEASASGASRVSAETVAARVFGSSFPANASWQTTFKTAEEQIDIAEFVLPAGVSNRFAAYGQYGNYVPYYWTAQGLALSRPSDIVEYLGENCRVGSVSSAAVVDAVLSASDTIIKVRGKEIAVPYDRFYFVFIDDMPDANWAHPCRYVFISEDCTSFTVLYKMWPPSLFSASTGESFNLKPIGEEDDVSSKVKSMEEIAKSVYDYARSMERNSSYSYHTGDKSKSYFVLISGGSTPTSNRIRFWNDTAILYSTLTCKYGVSKDHITVLMSDGSSTDKDANLGTDKSPVLVDSPRDLDGDGVADVSLAANYANAQSVFSNLKSKLTANDQLFVFMTSHGGPEGTAAIDFFDSYIDLFSKTGDWNETYWIEDYELDNWTKEIKCPVAFAIEACYSGGFIDDIIGTANRVIATACNHYESSFGGPAGGSWVEGVVGSTYAYNCWAFAFNCALRGAMPGPSIATGLYPWDDDPYHDADADANRDGKVSFYEAQAYAYDNDTMRCTASTHPDWCSFYYDDDSNYTNGAEHPQYASNPSGLGSSFFVLKQGTASVTTVVTFNPLGGSFGSGVTPIVGGNTTATLTKGSTGWNTPASRKPTKSGYTFAGFWTDPSAGTQLWDANMKYVGGTAYWTSGGAWNFSGSVLTAYARWTASSSATYTTVTLDPNGGAFGSGVTPISGGKTTAKLTYGKSDWSTPASRKPTKSGYTFNGFWTATSGGTQVWDKDMKYVNGTYWSAGKWNYSGSALTVYARWTSTSTAATVTLNPNGGSFASGVTPIVNGNTTATLTSGSTGWNNCTSRKPSKSGYAFNGFWTATSGGTQIWDANMKYVGGTTYWTADGKWKYTGNLTVYARWVAYGSFYTGGDANWTKQSDGSWKSGAIGDGKSTWLKNTATGAGTLTFRWKTSSEDGCDELKLYVDGAFKYRVSGEKGYAQKSVTVTGTGLHTFTWIYVKDDSYANGSDCGWVTDYSWAWSGRVTLNANGGSFGSSVTPVVGGNTPAATVKGKTDWNTPTSRKPSRTGYAFNGFWTATSGGVQVWDENMKYVGGTAYWSADGKWEYDGDIMVYARWVPNGTFFTGGDAKWTQQSDGSWKSGVIGNGQSTWLKNTVTGAGTMGFSWKTSSEANYDELALYVDGSFMFKISGEMGSYLGQGVSVPGTGLHTFTWIYSKDGSVASGGDCGWVKDFAWVPNRTTVTLNPNGGAFGSGVSPISGGNTTAMLTSGKTDWSTPSSRKPTKSGYTFNGFWTATSGGTQVWDANMKFVGGTAYWTSGGTWGYSGETLTVYARWK